MSSWRLQYEWNDLESAAHHLKIGIEQSERIGNLLIQGDGLRTLSIVQQASGNPGAALATLKKADQLTESRQVAPSRASATLPATSGLHWRKRIWPRPGFGLSK